MHSVIKMPLYLVVPCHLPISATVETYRQALSRCYLPLVEALEKQTDVQVSLHLSGHLLDLLARHDEQVLLRLKTLCQSGQVEILGGLFYGGPVALLPERDVRGQVAMSQEFWESFIGVTPQGIYLPQLAWAPELPRLLEDTGILYSFMGSNQRMASANADSILGRLERGGQRLYTFTLDYNLSQNFAPDQVPAFMARLTQHHAQQLGAIRPLLHGGQQSWGTGICLPAELFGAWGLGEGAPIPSIGPLLAALAEHPLYETALPLSHFTKPTKVVSVALGSCYAPIVPPYFNLDPLHDWSQFPGHFFEADTLYRRMLRASAALRDMIARMEDENREQQWSDSLATAQRLLFASQSIDGLGRGLWPGFADPAVRDAVMGRILRAEAALEALDAEGEQKIEVQRKDFDGDRIPDIFVSTPAFNIWLLPGRGGAIRTLEHKALGTNIFDVGARREDPFRAQAVLAPHDAAGDVCAVSHLRLLPRKGDAIGQQVDVCERQGLRDWLVPQHTSPAALISGHVRSLADIRRPWTLTCDTADDEALLKGQYHLGLSWDACLSLGGCLHITKDIRLDGPRRQLVLSYTFTPQGDDFPQEGVLWGVEMPWRWGGAALAIATEPNPARGRSAGAVNICSAPTTLRIEGGDTKIAVAMTGVDELWWAERHALVRDPDGFEEVPGGIVTLAITKVVAAPKSLELRLSL